MKINSNLKNNVLFEIKKFDKHLLSWRFAFVFNVIDSKRVVSGFKRDMENENELRDTKAIRRK